MIHLLYIAETVLYSWKMQMSLVTLDGVFIWVELLPCFSFMLLKNNLTEMKLHKKQIWRVFVPAERPQVILQVFFSQDEHFVQANHFTSSHVWQLLQTQLSLQLLYFISHFGNLLCFPTGKISTRKQSVSCRWVWQRSRFSLLISNFKSGFTGALTIKVNWQIITQIMVSSIFPLSIVCLNLSDNILSHMYQWLSGSVCSETDLKSVTLQSQRKAVELHGNDNKGNFSCLLLFRAPGKTGFVDFWWQCYHFLTVHMLNAALHSDLRICSSDLTTTWSFVRENIKTFVFDSDSANLILLEIPFLHKR